MPLDLQKAGLELNSKSIHAIHYETAWTWASRAVVAFNRYLKSGQLQWLLDAEEYGHEACEHAACVDSQTVAEVANAIEPIRQRAQERALRAG